MKKKNKIDKNNQCLNNIKSDDNFNNNSSIYLNNLINDYENINTKKEVEKYKKLIR